MKVWYSLSAQLYNPKRCFITTEGSKLVSEKSKGIEIVIEFEFSIVNFANL